MAIMRIAVRTRRAGIRSHNLIRRPHGCRRQGGQRIAVTTHSLFRELAMPWCNGAQRCARLSHFPGALVVTLVSASAGGRLGYYRAMCCSSRPVRARTVPLTPTRSRLAAGGSFVAVVGRRGARCAYAALVHFCALARRQPNGQSRTRVRTST